ncbi:hypothetical protein C1646_441444 [Rhizophagus diaphanus]|nr:hypothetical protein C1646_441444 [Rhizophagus diaphanus] [Rhizophagus sp. MUCL 43196]
MVVQQIYNYMRENELRYGILTTYDNRWFLRREHTELWISKTLPLQSESSPVLKTYAYLTRQAKEHPKSPHPQVLVSFTGTIINVLLGHTRNRLPVPQINRFQINRLQINNRFLTFP